VGTMATMERSEGAPKACPATPRSHSVGAAPALPPPRPGPPPGGAPPPTAGVAAHGGGQSGSVRMPSASAGFADGAFNLRCQDWAALELKFHAAMQLLEVGRECGAAGGAAAPQVLKSSAAAIQTAVGTAQHGGDGGSPQHPPLPADGEVLAAGNAPRSRLGSPSPLRRAVSKTAAAKELGATAAGAVSTSEVSTAVGSSGVTHAAPSSCCGESVAGLSQLSQATSSVAPVPSHVYGGAPVAASQQVASSEHPGATMDSSASLNVLDLAVHTAQGMQRQLDEMIGVVRLEQREREQLVAMVGGLSRRLDDGLASIGEVAAARSETEGATDAVLTAMRRCIDELSAQCAWPPPGAAESEGPHARTMVEAVHHQQVQLRQLASLQAQLQAQHEEHRQTVGVAAAWMQEQQQRLDESVAAVTEVQRELRARQQQQEAELVSVAMAVREEAAADGGGNAAALQELRSEVATIASAVNVLLGRVNDLSEEVRSPQNALQTEIGAIASVVSTLSHRVDRLAGGGSGAASCKEPAAPALSARAVVDNEAAEPGDTQEPMETSQALRQRLAALVGNVRHVDDERREAEAALARYKEQHGCGLPLGQTLQARPQKAPSPRMWLQEPLSVAVGRELRAGETH